MTNLNFKIGRATLLSAAMLSLAVLAGCSNASSEGDLSDGVAETAALPPTDDTPSVPDPLLDFNRRMTDVGDRVRFELDRYDLTPQAEQVLQQQAALLQQYPQLVITIEGHADERGTREYNLALGERRADTVRNYLIALGIPGDRISVVSYGKERPECADADENCWAMNRRGVTVASR